jgi:hypothetical protein
MNANTQNANLNEETVAPVRPVPVGAVMGMLRDNTFERNENAYHLSQANDKNRSLIDIHVETLGRLVRYEGQSSIEEAFDFMCESGAFIKLNSQLLNIKTTIVHQISKGKNRRVHRTHYNHFQSYAADKEEPKYYDGNFRIGEFKNILYPMLRSVSKPSAFKTIADFFVVSSQPQQPTDSEDDIPIAQLVANKKRQQQEAKENELMFIEDTDAPAPLIYKEPEQTEFDCGYCGVNTQVEYHGGEKNSLCKSCYTICDNNFTYEGEYATVRPDVENLDNSPITQIIVAKKLKRSKPRAVVVPEPVVPEPEPVVPEPEPYIPLRNLRRGDITRLLFEAAYGSPEPEPEPEVIVVAQKPKRKYVRKPKAVVVPEPVVPEPEPETIVVAPKPKRKYVRKAKPIPEPEVAMPEPEVAMPEPEPEPVIVAPKFVYASHKGECGLNADGTKILFPFFLMGACGEPTCVRRIAELPIPTQVNKAFFEKVARTIKQTPFLDWDWVSFQTNILEPNREHIKIAMGLNEFFHERVMDDLMVVLNNWGGDYDAVELEEAKEEGIVLVSHHTFFTEENIEY